MSQQLKEFTFLNCQALTDMQAFIFKEQHFILQVTESIFLYEKDVFFFLSCDPTLCSGRGVGDYLLLEQTGAWTVSILYICVCARVEVSVCMCAGV